MSLLIAVFKSLIIGSAGSDFVAPTIPANAITDPLNGSPITDPTTDNYITDP